MNKFSIGDLVLFDNTGNPNDPYNNQIGEIDNLLIGNTIASVKLPNGDSFSSSIKFLTPVFTI